MKIVLVIVGLIVVCGFLFVKSDISALPIKFYKANISNVDYVFGALEKTPIDHSYVNFVFNSDKAIEGSHIELQFSRDKGVIGFDWVLIGPEKLRDEIKFVEYARERNYLVRRFEENNIKYLRIENGDLVALCKGIMKDMYAVDGYTKIEVVAKYVVLEELSLSTE